MTHDSDSLRERLVASEPPVPVGEPRMTRECAIVERWEESPRYLGVRAEVPESFREAHKRPGQYVTLGPKSKEPKFLVIASSHSDGRTTWEFLVDRETEVGRSLEEIDAETSLVISPPEGAGYPVDGLRDGPLYCFTTGSGIASINPVAEWYLDEAEAGPSRLDIYHGEYSPEDHPYKSREERWRGSGIRLVRCDTSTAPTQYVQQAFLADELPLENATVFLAGAPVMKRAVIEMLEERGFPIERIHTNV